MDVCVRRTEKEMNESPRLGKARETHMMAGEAQLDKSSEMGSWSDFGSTLRRRVREGTEEEIDIDSGLCNRIWEGACRTGGQGGVYLQGELKLGDVVRIDDEGGLVLDHLKRGGGGGEQGRRKGQCGGGFMYEKKDRDASGIACVKAQQLLDAWEALTFTGHISL